MIENAYACSYYLKLLTILSFLFEYITMYTDSRGFSVTFFHFNATNDKIWMEKIKIEFTICNFKKKIYKRLFYNHCVACCIKVM